jgi:hypothetical protein
MTMKAYRWLRIILAAIAVEVAAIVAVFVVVAIFGPNTQAAATEYANKVGEWVGPIAGAIFSLIAAWLVARSVPERRVAHGVLVGCVVALIDVLLLVGMAASFRWLFVASDAAKIGAAFIGGSLARTRP